MVDVGDELGDGETNSETGLIELSRRAESTDSWRRWSQLHKFWCLRRWWITQVFEETTWCSVCSVVSASVTGSVSVLS
ncbi:hypothetical protein TorRG33x02_278280 [Trema orientale]|uniref:Uncharacterized protein n=1 Tax=Trema orientale TaxID=63057 RepID=A0A2P5CNN1_TREOI|nr:hypothetical protein TorRG33x02_278280 [Trema orientale]